MKSVDIEINNYRKIFAIKEVFSEAFPNLKMEFYAKSNTRDGAHSDQVVRNSAATVGDCRTASHSSHLSIHSNMKSGDLKNVMRDEFGLKITIYKRLGSEWIETAESATLEELNRSKPSVL